MRRLFAGLAALAALLCLPAAAPGAVPRGWVGVNLDGPGLGAGLDLRAETAAMVGAGVQTVRAPFFWAEAQRYARLEDVPPDERGRMEVIGGVPTDFGSSDRIVAAAAERGLAVLPALTGAPTWAAARPGDSYAPPRGTASYAAYARAVVQRYGPAGSFWRARPGLRRRPIRDYQIWNEPSLRGHWSIQPFATAYVRLLRAARRAIRGADPRARIVLAGFPNFSWRELRKVYRAGGRRAFDLAAVHPYSLSVRNVVRIVGLNRDVMRAYGDRRKPIVLSEVSWSSGRGHVRESPGFTTLTERGQADRIRAALPALAAVRRRHRIANIFWYTWLSPPLGSPNAFDYSGLRRLEPDGRITSKPALAAFRAAARRIS